ncbi:Aldo/keto reductase [Ramaria rubella]|nr:Aldo/keto reductase [Ramaria rubella]
MMRDMERDIIPMCIKEGMAIAPWGSVGQGRFKSKDDIEEHKQSGEIDSLHLKKKISAALEKVGKELNASITSVALAYCLQRSLYVFPIVGGHKVVHLLDNIKAVDLHLSEEQIKYLEAQTMFDPGFPYTVFGSDPRRFGETQGIMQKMYLNLAWVKHTPAIS